MKRKIVFRKGTAPQDFYPTKASGIITEWVDYYLDEYLAGRA